MRNRVDWMQKHTIELELNRQRTTGAREMLKTSLVESTVRIIISIKQQHLTASEAFRIQTECHFHSLDQKQSLSPRIMSSIGPWIRNGSLPKRQKILR